MSIKRIAFLQGISDWFRFNNKVPYYWRHTPESKDWKRGYNYANNWNKR